jgi:hypothetical protein
MYMVPVERLCFGVVVKTLDSAEYYQEKGEKFSSRTSSHNNISAEPAELPY